MLLSAAAAALGATLLGLLGTPNALDRRVEALPLEELPPAVIALVAGVSDLGRPLVALIVAGSIGLWLALRRRWSAAGFLVATTAAAAALFPLLKRAFALPRPGQPLVEAAGYGLPSGHTLVSTVLWGCLAWLLVCRTRPAPWRRAGALACLAPAVAIGLSRVVLAVHWLSDVVAGWLYGLACLGLAVWLDTRGSDAE